MSDCIATKKNRANMCNRWSLMTPSSISAGTLQRPCRTPIYLLMNRATVVADEAAATATQGIQRYPAPSDLPQSRLIISKRRQYTHLPSSSTHPCL